MRRFGSQMSTSALQWIYLFFRDFAPLHNLAFWKNNIGWSHKPLNQGTFATNLISAGNTNWTNTNNFHKNFPSSRLSQRLSSNTLAPFLPTFRIVKLTAFVATASLLIASRGEASLQKFEKCALTIFCLEPDPYKSAHQPDCSFFSLQQWPMEPKGTTISCYQTSKQTSAAINRQHAFWNTTETN